MTQFEAAVLANQKTVFTALIELQKRLEVLEHALRIQPSPSIITPGWFDNIQTEYNKLID